MKTELGIFKEEEQQVELDLGTPQQESNLVDQEPVIKKKKGRGRPKLSEAEKAVRKAERLTKKSGNTDSSMPDDISSALEAVANTSDEIFNPESSTPPTDIPKEHQEHPKEMDAKISGYVLLMIMDSLFPYATAMMVSRFMGKDIDAKKLKLTTTERKELQPMADEVAKGFVGASPASMFVMTSLSMYFGKVMGEL